MDPTQVLVEAFEASGMDEKALSEKSGVHVITVKRYLKGEIKKIGPANAQRLAAALGIDPQALIFGRVVTSPTPDELAS